jgi:hypothetical protein
MPPPHGYGNMPSTSSQEPSHAARNVVLGIVAVILVGGGGVVALVATNHSASTTGQTGLLNPRELETSVQDYYQQQVGPGDTITKVSCIEAAQARTFVCNITDTYDNAVTHTITVSKDGQNWISDNVGGN